MEIAWIFLIIIIAILIIAIIIMVYNANTIPQNNIPEELRAKLREAFEAELNNQKLTYKNTALYFTLGTHYKGITSMRWMRALITNPDVYDTFEFTTPTNSPKVVHFNANPNCTALFSFNLGVMNYDIQMNGNVIKVSNTETETRYRFTSYNIQIAIKERHEDHSTVTVYTAENGHLIENNKWVHLSVDSTNDRKTHAICVS